jgi:hypothetical protein
MIKLPLTVAEQQDILDGANTNEVSVLLDLLVRSQEVLLAIRSESKTASGHFAVFCRRLTDQMFDGEKLERWAAEPHDWRRNEN